MAKFQVVGGKGAGKHRHGGRTYRAGEVIETSDDLATAFPDRFELLEGDKALEKSRAAKEASGPKVVETHTPYDNAHTKKNSSTPTFETGGDTPPDDELDQDGDRDDDDAPDDGTAPARKPARHKAVAKKKR